LAASAVSIALVNSFDLSVLTVIGENDVRMA
jgi:hypothetical protein